MAGRGRVAPATPATPRTPATPKIRIENPKEDKEIDQYRFLYPPVPVHIAQACFIMNCILPGSGTFLMSLSVCCCGDTNKWSGGDKCFAVFFGLIIALFQVALAVIIVGWVWSIIWGVKYVFYAKKRYGLHVDEESDDEGGAPRELPNRRLHSPRPHLYPDIPDTRPSTSSSVSSVKRVSWSPNKTIDRESADSGVPSSPYSYLEPAAPPSPILPESYRPPTGRSVSTASL